MTLKIDLDYFDEFGGVDDDVYSSDFIEELLSNDEISNEEAGFMVGYNEGE